MVLNSLFNQFVSKRQILRLMKNTVVNPVKKAASIVLCRSFQSLNSMYDYQVLMLERKGSLSSFGSMLAFPGGKFDHQTDDQIAKLGGLSNSIMATVLRECFQQTGIYITEKPIVQTSKISNLNQIKLNFIASEFYKKSILPGKSDKVYEKNSKQEIQVCNYLKQLIQALPPKKNLLPFIRLVTVPLLKQRFDAFFYVHKLEEFKFINFMKYAESQKYLHLTDHIVTNDESSTFGWHTPLHVIRQFVEKKVKLAPPQFIMLNIMLNFHKYKQFEEFLKQCAHNEINMGPNIVSMINNTGSEKSDYPYAATLLGDLEFPYEFCMKNQKNQYLINEVKLLKQKLGNPEQKYKNRLLFKKPLQFFEEEYSNECNISGSVMSKFLNSNKIRKQLQLYQ